VRHSLNQHQRQSGIVAIRESPFAVANSFDKRLRVWDDAGELGHGPPVPPRMQNVLVGQATESIWVNRRGV
jgi:hypothetical protein